MLKTEAILHHSKKRPLSSGRSPKPLHIHILPLLLSVLFLCSLLYFRQLMAQDLSAAPAAGTAAAGGLAAGQPAEGETQAEARLDIEMIYQNPELPNGCEATSLAIALGVLGYPADKLTIAYDYLPSGPFTEEGGVLQAPDPDVMYPGDPATDYGFYCFGYPVTAAADRYLYEQGSPWTAREMETVSREQLEAAVQSGSPVIIWSTIDYGGTAQYHADFSWVLLDGEQYIPYSNLHCTVVYGFDRDCFLVCDPLEGELTIQKDVLLRSMAALGNHAVYFQEITQ